MNCPEDAKPQEDSNNWCHFKVPEEILKTIVKKHGDWSSRWFCTRPKLHEGDHHAHGKSANSCAAIWTQEEALVEAL